MIKSKENDKVINVSRVSIEEIAVIKSILKEVKLPLNGIEDHLYNFLKLKVDGNIIGTIGFEVYGQQALLRSFAIKPGYQGNGYGQILYKSLISRAKELNVVEIYLLTDSASEFFAKNGFIIFKREDAPEVIKNTHEFNIQRCMEADCMKLLLKY
jgi:amino-acid N-acetyltransferase